MSEGASQPQSRLEVSQRTDRATRTSGRRRGRSKSFLHRLVVGGGIAVGVVGLLTAPAAARSRVGRKADAVADAARGALVALTTFGDDAPVEVAAAANANYVAARHQLAAVVAERSSVDVDELDAAWARAGRQRMTAVLAALTQVGTPYSYASADPGVGFDCSGLTSWAWGLAGVTLDHSSYGQLATEAARPQEAAAAGDLVGLRGRGHVAIYLGVGDAVVHAPNTGSWVEVTKLANRLQWFVYPAQ
jgi:cell wall-associated NlpC family hydrolase